MCMCIWKEKRLRVSGDISVVCFFPLVENILNYINILRELCPSHVNNIFIFVC